MTVNHEVTGYLGKKVVLPCNIVVTEPEMQVSQVTWVKEVEGRRQNVAVYHPKHGQNYPMEKNSRRIVFHVPSLTDATLVIEHLLMTDEGTYSCEFATYPHGNEIGTTNLIVLGKNNQALAFNLQVDGLQLAGLAGLAGLTHPVKL